MSAVAVSHRYASCMLRPCGDGRIEISFLLVLTEHSAILFFSFWKRLGHLMSKLNPEPNVIHVMGCYVLGNHNGEKVKIHFLSPCPPPTLISQGRCWLFLLAEEMFKPTGVLWSCWSVVLFSMSSVWGGDAAHDFLPSGEFSRICCLLCHHLWQGCVQCFA